MGFARLDRPDPSALEAYVPDRLLPRATRERVLARYDEPHRFYHDRSHVLQLFASAWREAVPLTAAQSLALLYHDAVYLPGAPSGQNERLSAWAMRCDAHVFTSGVDVDRVARIIEDTAQHEASVPESQVVLDLDLSPLAAAPTQFLAANELVWLENRHLLEDEDDPRCAFDYRRLRFLEALAARGPLFSVLMHLEAAARANLRMLREAARRERGLPG